MNDNDNATQKKMICGKFRANAWHTADAYILYSARERKTKCCVGGGDRTWDTQKLAAPPALEVFPLAVLAMP